jgi:hypothetical protein
MLYFSSTRDGGCGGYDLWQVPILQSARDLAEDSEAETAGEAIER